MLLAPALVAAVLFATSATDALLPPVEAHAAPTTRSESLSLPNLNLSGIDLSAPGLGDPPQQSNRCVTPRFWCALKAPASVGASCWCSTPSGPVTGFVKAR